MSRPKDGVETRLKTPLCIYLNPTVHTCLPRSQAQLVIDSNWTTASG